MTVAAQITRFIVENFYVAEPERLSPDTSLIAEGIVDSTGMLEVIAFLEADLGVAVDDREAVPENLETIGRIAAFVERKRAAAA
jgi:acyl carrier protein